jgi:hypothetical protein
MQCAIPFWEPIRSDTPRLKPGACVESSEQAWT